MGQRSEIPFNITLLDLNPQRLQGLKPVTKLDIFDGAGNNFSEEGLFSTSIFGRVGDERRNQRFSYIDVRVPIFHPVVFRAIVALKRLYGGIIAGTEYAIWDPTEKDFEKADQITGQTGFHFFLEHWQNINHGLTKSTSRDQQIKLLDKYSAVALTSHVVVMPAGMRDLEVDDSGRMKEDEINTLYRQLLSVANTISSAAVKLNPEQTNTARWKLQTTFNELYDTIENMLAGKKKLILGKYGSRRIFNGTRNVITAMDTAIPYLGAAGAPDTTNTVIGLYQMLKCIMPIARYHIRNGFLSEVFRAVSAPSVLVNKKTLKTELVQLKSHYFDRFATDEGLEKVITSFFDLSLRHKPMEVEGRYLGLIYKGPDGTFKLMHDIDELPSDRSRDHVTPVTFAELLYISCFRILNNHPLFVTRYPVTGVGSIYPSMAYVKTTLKAEQRKQLSSGWEPQDDSYIAYEFPLRGVEFLDSLVPHSAHLKGLGADFDGDTSSGNATYTDESIAEVRNFLASKKAHVGTDGRFLASIDVETVALVLHNMTGD